MVSTLVHADEELEERIKKFLPEDIDQIASITGTSPEDQKRKRLLIENCFITIDNFMIDAQKAGVADVSGYKAETAVGEMNLNEAKDYCEKAKASISTEPKMGCGKAAMDMKSQGGGSKWSKNTFHPASMGGEFSATVRPIYEPSDCEQMPKKSNLASDVKPYESEILKLCGKGAVATTPDSGFSMTKIGPNNFKRETMVVCHRKDKADWDGGKVQFKN
jgi:hypothetical protein